MTQPESAAQHCQPAFTEREFRDALGQFATGVAVVTTCDAQGVPVGMTVNSFSSVSLQPALVLWSVAHSSGSYPVFAQCSHYAIHILGAHQQALAMLFAQRGVDRFNQVNYSLNAHGVPVLSDALVVLECQAHQQHVAGDHSILVGQVHSMRQQPQMPALLYHRGRMFPSS